MCFTTALMGIELREEECDLVKKNSQSKRIEKEPDDKQNVMDLLLALRHCSCMHRVHTWDSVPIAGYSGKQFVILGQPNISSKILHFTPT